MQKSAPRPSARAPATRPNRRPLAGCNSEAKAVAAPAIYTQSAAQLARHNLHTDRESEVDFAPITTRIEHKSGPKKAFDSAKTKVGGGRNSSYLKATSSFMQKLERQDSQQSLNSNYLAKISSRHHGSNIKKNAAQRSSFGKIPNRESYAASKASSA